ncbi:MAG: hypothetical protein COT35_09235 [Nitrospirae bacterium CG08_land_8_20_14_0_20_52_24]|nr:MAG: hypothetical protein COT35_09235 [Nitrospirae bacterium CG08_land_8_20_14_0_20_52_24]PIV82827.1 MAG: hypothetical protein COW52_11675 [Nitrospirae bacterium CG17_big_fil_post_rev_8_21_14_2_50_50_9]
MIMTVAERKTSHPYISVDSKIASGQPAIRGARITVMDIAIRYEILGMSADRIIDEYPHLKLEQIHDALSYYHEHKAAFDKKYREDQSFLANLKKSYPSKLRERLG